MISLDRDGGSTKAPESKRTTSESLAEESMAKCGREFHIYHTMTKKVSKLTNQLLRSSLYSKTRHVKRPKIQAFCINMPLLSKPEVQTKFAMLCEA